MTTPFKEPISDETVRELRAVEAGLDAIARDARSDPDAGFEDRLVAAATNALSGRPTLRLSHPRHERRVPSIPLVRWGLAGAALLAIGSAVVAMRWPSMGHRDGVDDGVVLASTTTELDEIAEVWDLLDDDAIASRAASLHGRASTISDSINGEWIPSLWLGEDSM